VKSVYLSSTSEDLREHRAAVIDFLRRCGYDVDAMEKYGARDDRPRAACEADVAQCDIYVGIFAWRYGHVPTDDNAQARSITELEYLRKRLQAEHWVACFGSPDDLAKKVLSSIIQSESTKPVGQVDALQDLQRAAEMGPSMFANIKERFTRLEGTDFLAIRIEPTVWWNSRLHLAAALASDFTELEQFLILDAAGQVPVMAAPVEIRRALTKSEPKFEAAYLMSRQLAADSGRPDDVNAVIQCYPASIGKVFQTDERSIKRDLTVRSLRELGIRNEGRVLERSGADTGLLSYADLMRGKERYVVLVRGGQLEGVIDRVDLASRMAAGGM
jgi:hypothetical protein